MRSYITLIFLLSIFMSPLNAYAVEYYCVATKKYGSDKTYSEKMIKKYKYATKIKESNGEAFLSRCSYSTTANDITCDKYKVDSIEYDNNVKIKKYYLFNSQANFQIFDNMTSLEDNGRGSVQYGKCTVTSP